MHQNARRGLGTCLAVDLFIPSRALSSVGLQFDPACLTFHENRRHARTASYAQVSEPLYDRSVGRWKHYRKHLEPVLPILAPVIERLGYTLD